MGEAETNDWRDDPSADERWNAGLDFAMTHLCKVLGVDPSSVNWDAATETLDGDVMSVIGNILRGRFGDDWVDALRPAAAPSPSPWLPIESAPRDGTEFQGWLVNELGAGFWQPKCRIEPEAEAFEIWDRTDYDIDGWVIPWRAAPTHWMPTPSAPTGGA